MTSLQPVALKAAASRQAVAAATAVIVQHSRSFSWASKLLPPAHRSDAVVLYAWCRRADDAVDDAPDAASARLALDRLQEELDDLYAGKLSDDIQLRAFSEVVARTAIPKVYPQELLEGMRMDVDGTHYADHATFLRYCFRAAGTVGLMMCHVLGATHQAALRRAAQLGMAMQITNICRDVAEDWQRDRLYLPQPLLARHHLAGLHAQLGQPLTADAAPPIAAVVKELLCEAEALYRSGQWGLRLLPWRAAVAIGVAQALYADIGRSLQAQGFDPLRGRAHTTAWRKLVLSAKVVAQQLLDLPRRWTGLGCPRQLYHGPAIQGVADILPQLEPAGELPSG